MNKRRIFMAVLLVLFLALAGVGGYHGLERFMAWYFTRAGETLVEREKRGELSRDYGYVWSEINLARKMRQINREITIPGIDSVVAAADTAEPATPERVYRDFPSLSAVRELNRIQQISNFIVITDCHDFPLGEIKTTHTRLRLDEFNPVLLNAIISSEDRNFYTRPLAYEYKAFVRAFFLSVGRTLIHLKFSRPRGTSTIHQQVAKFMLSKFDARGYVYTERSLSRKIRELKLAQALKMYYPQEELLQVYLNHCVNAGYGMTGFNDISQGLFGKKPAELDICQSLYLARLVKWNRNLPKKIIAQIKVDMPRMAPALGWDLKTQDSIKTALDRLTFRKPVRILSEHNPLIDLANENWLLLCRQNGMAEDEIADMDFSFAHTMIRRKGNLKIQLTIDLRLQKQLERLVQSRGFGRDTVIYTDVRIGSAGAFVQCPMPPRDTLRAKQRLRKEESFSEPGSQYSVMLRAGDTLITNIRYKRMEASRYRRSLYFYRRDTLHVNGQYYCYAMMNSRTGELLAYYSRDGIGSRLSALLRNKTPNGSSVAKPILYALNYDLGHFTPGSMVTDSVEVLKPLPWARTFLTENDKRVGMLYLNTSAPGGYPVSNHDKGFEGYDYLFNHLTESNNLLCVEMIYRLNTTLYDDFGEVPAASSPVFRLLDRLGDTVILGEGKLPPSVTGTQIYARIAGVVGAQVDSVAVPLGRIPLPPDYYSVALGTLELSLYQQMHLFNVLYNNELIAEPEKHPGLVIKAVFMSGVPVPLADSVVRRSLFSNIANIRPVQLGLHKRLVSNPADDLGRYDLPMDSALFPDNAPAGPLSNFAKSGTSDDIIRPYNRDIVTREKTNYGLWNAVLRLTLSKNEYDRLARKMPEALPDSLPLDSIPDIEQLDVTLACVGECNEKNTGARDGKTLHKFVSAGLLHAYGTPVDSGFYRHYEKAIIAETPDSIRFFNPYERPDIDSVTLEEIKDKTRKALRNDSLTIEKRFFFGFGLSKESYLRLLSFTPYLGNAAREYYDLVEKLNNTNKTGEMADILDQIKNIPVINKALKTDYDSALKSLSKSMIK